MTFTGSHGTLSGCSDQHALYFILLELCQLQLQVNTFCLSPSSLPLSLPNLPVSLIPSPLPPSLSLPLSLLHSPKLRSLHLLSYCGAAHKCLCNRKRAKAGGPPLEMSSVSRAFWKDFAVLAVLLPQDDRSVSELWLGVPASRPGLALFP